MPLRRVIGNVSITCYTFDDIAVPEQAPNDLEAKRLFLARRHIPRTKANIARLRVRQSPFEKEPIKLLPQYAASLSAHIEWMSGYCPVQAEGLVNELPFYFRARGNRCTFSVAPLGGDPISVLLGYESGYSVELQYGENFNAGWMPHDEAYIIIQHCASVYLQSEVK